MQSVVIHKGEYGSGKSLFFPTFTINKETSSDPSNASSPAGHYYSYVRPDIRQNEWYRFDDQFVTKVDYEDVVADAYGGNRRARRKRPRSESFESHDAPAKRQRGLFRRIFSLFGLFRRVKMIASSRPGGGGGGFGYGGRSSSAYMLQYVRRSDANLLYGQPRT